MNSILTEWTQETITTVQVVTAGQMATCRDVSREVSSVGSIEDFDVERCITID